MKRKLAWILCISLLTLAFNVIPSMANQLDNEEFEKMEKTIDSTDSKNEADVPTIFLDKKAIESKVHFNEINSIYKMNDNKEERSTAINQYLSQRNLKELLETAAEFSSEGHLDHSGMVLVPYIKPYLKNNDNIKQMSMLTKDKTYDHIFRMFVLNILCSNNLKGYLSEDITNTILSIGKDKTDNNELRRYALLNLRQPGTYNDSSGQSEILKIFKNDTESPIVRAAAITAMRRIEDSNFISTIEEIFSDPNKYSDIIIRHAVIDAAKHGIAKEYVDIIKNIAISTDNPDNYRSAIYSLGILKDKKAVMAILSAYARFDNKLVCEGALTMSYKTILEMLDLKQSDDTIISGIKAAQITQYYDAIQPLQLIVANSKNEQLQIMAKNAINEIKVAPENYCMWKED